MLIKNFFVQAEQGKTDMENYIARLEEEKAGLEKEVSDLYAVTPPPPPTLKGELRFCRHE